MNQSEKQPVGEYLKNVEPYIRSQRNANFNQIAFYAHQFGKKISVKYKIL